MATERKALPVIDKTRCTGCGWCVGVCPPRVLSLETVPNWQKKSTLHDAEGCTGCAKCVLKCPFDAVSMVRIPDPAGSRCAPAARSDAQPSSARQPATSAAMQQDGLSAHAVWAPPPIGENP